MRIAHAAARDDVVERTPHHACEIGGGKGWRKRIKCAGLNGLHIKTGVHDARHDDDIYGESSPLSSSQDVGPLAVGQFRVREDQRRRVLSTQHSNGLGA